MNPEIIGQGSNTYIVFLEGNNTVSAVRKGFEPQALLLGPIYLFRKVDKVVGIALGIVYFLLLRSLFRGTESMTEIVIELAIILAVNALISTMSFQFKLFELKLVRFPYVVCLADNEEDAILTGDRKLRP